MKSQYLESAVWQAKKSLSEGGLPIGAAMVCDDTILSVGHNRRDQHDDSIAHAELDCIRAAGLLTADIYSRAVIYSTLAPCWMCAGAIRLYGIPRVVVADDGFGVPGAQRWRANEAYFEDAGIQYQVERHAEMIGLFREFLRSSPEKWSGDVGE